MREVTAVFHRTKSVSIFPIEGDRFLIDACLQDEVHDVRIEVEILHPALEIVAARAEMRSGPFTEVCRMPHPVVERLVGMTIGRGFVREAKKIVSGPRGCHRLSELIVEIAQAAYQLHFVRFFSSLPAEVRNGPDNPALRRRVALEMIPGLEDTCFSYNTENEALIARDVSPIQLRQQDLPRRKLA